MFQEQTFSHKRLLLQRYANRDLTPTTSATTSMSSTTSMPIPIQARRARHYPFVLNAPPPPPPPLPPPAAAAATGFVVGSPSNANSAFIGDNNYSTASTSASNLSMSPNATSFINNQTAFLASAPAWWMPHTQSVVAAAPAPATQQPPPPFAAVSPLVTTALPSYLSRSSGTDFANSFAPNSNNNNNNNNSTMSSLDDDW
jgi:hypothetical protein